jgi:hypothetical protein
MNDDLSRADAQQRADDIHVLIANAGVEYMQVRDRRAGSRSMDRSHKTGTLLVARKHPRNRRIAEPAQPVK